VEVGHPEVEHHPRTLQGPAEGDGVGRARRADLVLERELVLAALERHLERAQAVVVVGEALDVERRPVEGRRLDPLSQVEPPRAVLGREPHRRRPVRRS
jgi:hypothetical protein